MKRILIQWLFVFSGLASISPFAIGGGDSSASGSRLDPMHQLTDKQRFQQAIEKHDKAPPEDSNDAERLNLPGYSQRQLQRYDLSMGDYRKALQFEPATGERTNI